MSEGTGLAEAMLGVRVLEVRETADEVVVVVETTADLVAASGAARERRRMIGCGSTCAISRASAGRRGWCGTSADGGAARRCETPGHDRDVPVVARQAGITRPPTGITRRSTRPAWSTCNAAS